MSIFCCPKCRGKFIAESKTYRCENGHLYDRASGGYVNLLPPGGKQHGDDRAMLRARREFLESGGYAPLRDALAQMCADLPISENAAVLDAGCGEGYYTEAVFRQMPNVRVYGVDVSKDAVKMCDGRHLAANFAVASVYDLPVADHTCELVISVFSPFAREEFYRVMKPNGFLVSVIPDTRHLWGLKRVLYDEPYENRIAPYAVEGFNFVKMVPISFTLHLQTKEQILSLYRMTPYCYRTGKAGAERIEAQNSLSTEASFQILLYQKA